MTIKADIPSEAWVVYEEDYFLGFFSKPELAKDTVEARVKGGKGNHIVARFCIATNNSPVFSEWGQTEWKQ